MVADTRDDAAPLTRLGRLLWGEGALTALLVIALAGVGISIYLTTVHYAHVPLFCSVTQVINCAAVTSSAYSVVPGTQIPITIPGMLWFLVSGGLAVVALRAVWRGGAEPSWLRQAHVVWALGGMAFVLYLVVVELDILHQICEWCTGVHVLTALTFIIVLVRLLEARGKQLADEQSRSGSPATAAAKLASSSTRAASPSTRAGQPVGAATPRAGSSSGGAKRRGGSRGRKRR